MPINYGCIIGVWRLLKFRITMCCQISDNRKMQYNEWGILIFGCTNSSACRI